MKKVIMVVDDDPDLGRTVKYGLEDVNPNYEIVYAASGEKCFEYLENNEFPDIILLDIMMPGMTGWEVLARLKENDSWKNIPIIFLTARTDVIAKNAGGFLAEDYIEKPFEILELETRINKVIKK